MSMETVTYRVTNDRCLILISTAQAQSIVSVSADQEGATIVVCIKGDRADLAFAKCGALRID